MIFHSKHLIQNLSEEKAKSLKAETDLKELENKLNEVQTKFEETENLDKTLKDNLSLFSRSVFD
jgi:septal ring factor EnvC (AmiA/AmiB activator)